MILTTAGAQFDELFAAGGSLDPHPLYKELRTREPVFWSEGTNAWVLTRYADVRSLFASEDKFAVLHGEAGATIHGKTLLQMRGEEHRKKNAVVAGQIRNLRRLRGDLTNLVEGVVGELVSTLVETDSTVELRSALTGALPLAVVCALLGIDRPGELRGWYRDLANAGVENLIGDADRHTAGLRALHRFEAVIAPVIDSVRSQPTDNLLSALAQAEYEGVPLPEEELTTLAGFLLTAGVETTDRTLASLLYLLGTRKDDWRRLQNDPGLITSAIAEVLRFDSAVQGVGRMALVDAEFTGVPVRRGERVIGLIGSANRDERVFADPDSFRLDRFADTADSQFTPRGRLVTFGAGPHQCTGSLLAKLELSTVVRELLTRFTDIELDPATPSITGVMLRSPERLIAHLVPRT